jgi:hypothetical protein
MEDLIYLSTSIYIYLLKEDAKISQFKLMTTAWYLQKHDELI